MSGPSRRTERSSKLSSPPEKIWPDGVLHHGVRVVLLLGLAVLYTFVFPPDPAARVQPFDVGTVAEEEVIAEVPFDVPLAASELEQARAEARGAVPPTFDYRPAAADSMAARISALLDRVQAAAMGPRPDSAVADVLEAASIDLTDAQIDLLTDPRTFSIIRRTAEEASREILPLGVADSPDLSEVGTERVTVRDPGAEGERSIEVDRILSPREFFDRAISLLPADASPDLQEILRLLLIQNLEFTYSLNASATEQDREGAARAVPTTGQRVVEGQAIVRANELITPAIQSRLSAYRAQLETEGLLEGETEARLAHMAGQTLLNLLLLGIFGLLVFFYRNEVYTNLRWILLVTVLIAVYAGGAGVVVRNGWPLEALPVAFVALAVAILWDGRMALVLALALAALSAVQPGMTGVAGLVPTAVGGAAAALAVRAVRRRSQAWIFIALIASAYAAAILALGLVYGFGGPETVLNAFVAAGANTILSTLIAMGFLPVFELVTGITTDQTLLEWADPNRSLLKRLSMEAPGTYAHTINVANLAEAAATAIGANGLLSRVGLYYHDVGKMLKPHYYVENQPDGRNPHDKLKPDTSAAIVKEHVTEGLRLVREAKVPDIVAAFVGEHHGTQRIGFFWDKAKEEYGEENLDIEDFTYPGPRPRSKETAIAMLADSVESATRALKDPTRERIRGLIDSIVDAKIADRQLDEAPVTLAEIATIKDQFAKVLSGVHHHRIDYPETRHLTESPGGAEDAAAAAGAEGSEDVPDAAPAPGATSPPAEDRTAAAVVKRRRSGERPSDESQLSLDDASGEPEPDPGDGPTKRHGDPTAGSDR